MKRATIRKPCEFCGEDFDARVDSIKDGGGRCCSRECHFALRRSARVALVCAYCASDFEVIPAVANDPDRGKYCSVPCYRAGRVYEVRPLPERFWEKVDRRGPDECWEWTGARQPDRYGRIALDSAGNLDQAHRVSWLFAFGPIPDGLWALHKCDNRGCVNPNHLFLGTNEDNVNDKVSKGRQLRGESSPVSTLTEVQVVEIRTRRAAGGVTYKELARDYGVQVPAIQKIVNRERWKHLP